VSIYSHYNCFARCYDHEVIDGEPLTIDELARRAGTATSTVRMYQARGLLPPPTRRGRIGVYGASHLARLRLIAQLQEQGFSLASIKRIADAWENGRGLEDIMGLEVQVAAAWGPEEPLRLPADEFAARFYGQEVSLEIVQRAIGLGLIELDGSDVVVKRPRFLEIGSELARLGIPSGEILDDFEGLQEAADDIAARFVGVFERHLWAAFVERGLPSEEIRLLTESIQRLSTLAESVVVAALRDSLRRRAGAFLAREAMALDEGRVLEELRPLAEAAGLDL
jgi:DNA-binding transcriptional MerR regulator